MARTCTEKAQGHLGIFEFSDGFNQACSLGPPLGSVGCNEPTNADGSSQKLEVAKDSVNPTISPKQRGWQGSGKVCGGWAGHYHLTWEAQAYGSSPLLDMGQGGPDCREITSNHSIIKVKQGEVQATIAEVGGHWL